MTNATDLIDRYIATWNETDTERRHALIARTWTPEGGYVDPLMEATGHDAMNAMLGAVQERFPGARLARTSDVDAHHEWVRFSWSLTAAEGAPIVGGLDVGVITGERLAAITGFIDAAPVA